MAAYSDCPMLRLPSRSAAVSAAKPAFPGFAAVLLSLLLFFRLPLPPLKAQVSAPDLLNSQFAGGFDSSPAMRSTLLRSFRGERDAPGIVWEGRDELTVHVNKGHEGLREDLHVSGSVLTIRALLGRPANAPRLTLRWEHLGGGGVDNESGNALRFRSRFDQPEGQVSWPLSRSGQAYFGLRSSAYSADGTTRLYDGIFTIFPQTPPFRYRGRERLVLAGLSLPLSRFWAVEAAAGYKEEPNSMKLFQEGSAAQVTFPLRDAGATSLLAVRRRLTDDTAVFAVLSGERLRGTAPVERENGRRIGEAVTTHRESGWGGGWQKTFGERRALGVFLENAQERWETAGTVPNPGDLQTRYVFTSDLHYGARYALTRYALGVNWDQRDRRQRDLQASVQLLALKINVDADYDLRFYGLARSGRTSYNQNNVRAAEVHIGYALPFRSVRLGVGFSQIVPLSVNKPASAAGAAASGPPDPNRRTTSGGWTVSLRVEKPF